MLKKLLIWLLLLILAGSLIWCAFITFKFPYVGIDLTLNKQNEWVIEELAEENANKKLDVKVGDIIKQVDGIPPRRKSCNLQMEYRGTGSSSHRIERRSGI
ncbi:hypothetical protein P4H70_26760 [Paenibacillus ehimensis]|uniref:hypothetical protein n=1 Tax=Paenibacillus ehimensis TaxID=79264 RepID=UPI002DBAEFA3|nr:hypothetical protein [Paenibacillus ehimensis]MEC0212538.1 hypothetical protein [Paenibacillus ehimensis]